MKNNFFLVAAAVAVLSTACNDSNTESSTTDTSATTSTPVADNPGVASVSSSFDENASYVDLKTNKPVRLKKSEGSPYLLDYETNQPYSYFFYNPATNDTFDRSGYVVNNYLLRGDDGTYTLDEERWRTKIDADGDVKTKDGEETKIKQDASSGEIKVKTGDTTVKY